MGRCGCCGVEDMSINIRLNSRVGSVCRCKRYKDTKIQDTERKYEVCVCQDYKNTLFECQKKIEIFSSRSPSHNSIDRTNV